MKDIASAPGDAGSAPASLAPRGRMLLFSAWTPTRGRELWRSDGTAAGTKLVDDLDAGTGADPDDVVEVGKTIYFTAYHPAHGRSLWRTRGSAASTRLVLASSAAIPEIDIVESAAVNGTLFFTLQTEAHGLELWKSNGTRAGTMLVKDIAPGTLGSEPTELTSFRGELYFRARDTELDAELWRSDGSERGTRRVRDVLPGAEGSSPCGLTVVRRTLYFRASDGLGGHELWRTDGSVRGTQRVKDIAPGAASSLPGPFGVVGRTLYFFADDGVHGRELWRSDGTEAGTRLVHDVAAGADSSQDAATAPFEPDSAPAAAGRVAVFRASASPGSASSLWVTDGSAGGTTRIGPVELSPASEFTPLGRLAFFLGETDASGRELWRSDGTDAGTFMVKDIAPGEDGGPADRLTAWRGRLWFAADDGAHGPELWRSDGTDAGTELVVDLAAPTADANPVGLTDLNGTLLFLALDDAGDTGLWRSDGTEAGTTLIHRFDAPFSRGGLGATSLTRFGDAVLFGVRVGFGVEVWRSDGTEAGTLRLAQPWAGLAFGPLPDFAGWNGLLYFGVRDAVGPGNLWRTDGTPAGTGPLFADPAAPHPRASQLFALGGLLYFAGHTPETYTEPWRSDGTPEGTFLLRDIVPTDDDGGIGQEYASRPHDFRDAGGRVVFLASPPNSLPRLWTSDGTEAGTVRVDDDSDWADELSRLTSHAGAVLFVRRKLPGDPHQNAERWELWRTDGSDAGSFALAELPGPVTWLVDAGASVLFATRRGPAGAELWSSDGTSAGTGPVTALMGATADESAPLAAAVDGGVAFAGVDPLGGVEPSFSDGTAQGTLRLADAVPGAGSSFPRSFTRSGGNLFFSAIDDAGGRELWVVPLP